ncbi:hypothetical protein [Aliivibrio finisterrensis]|uniref:Uncharacterized protein n=1 Tax=Aliivibrio finisterrensis TaxID=511998 RepID=A0ABY0I6G8_9GAMM|nr:hypothetical protein [Aliivibrio finisterrensis]RYU62172.1 hypothetical protein ERW53_16800 [Aliivibrio finisterrensis]RYU84478.1 hypothetical protein ERW52_10945 [Aliivibrio finisterrensis]
MKNISSIKASYQELYDAVRSERVTALIAALTNTRRKHGAMVTCDLSEKAHRVFEKHTEIKRYKSLVDRLKRYKEQKQLDRFVDALPAHIKDLACSSQQAQQS